MNALASIYSLVIGLKFLYYNFYMISLLTKKISYILSIIDMLYQKIKIKSLMMALTEHCPSTWHMLIERLISLI